MSEVKAIIYIYMMTNFKVAGGIFILQTETNYIIIRFVHCVNDIDITAYSRKHLRRTQG